MTIGRQRTGRAAEQLVAERLRRAGWRILERNARTRQGEIDIVALDGRALVFVEVKSARLGPGPCPEMPELAVGVGKQRRLRRLGAAWLAERRGDGRFGEIRFDVVAVSFGAGTTVARYQHLRAAF
jgi:putative endonuclease